MVTYSSDLDKNPAARKEPIKDTQTLKEPIKGSHLGKRVRNSEDGPTNIDPIVTGFGIIGQAGSRTISSGIHTQSIVQGGKNIIHSDVITHVLTNSGELTLECEYFPFEPLKAETLMVAPLNGTFLESDGDVRLASIIGASRPDQSRIIAPGTNGLFYSLSIFDWLISCCRILSKSLEYVTVFKPVATVASLITQGDL